MGLALGGLISGIGSLFGAGTQASASKKAAAIQAQSALQAAGIQQQDVAAGLAQQSNLFNIGASFLSPFIQGGQNLYSGLTSMIPGMVKSFNPTISDLEKTPGYQFTLDQGNKAVINSMPGLRATGAPGSYSGPEMKGIDQYTTGLASNTYQQQFQNYWANIANTIQGYLSPASVGAGAAASGASMAGPAGNAALGAFGQLGTGQSASLTGAGQAGAAGILGAGAATAGGIAGVSNAANQYTMLQALLSGNAGGGGGGLGLGNNSILASLGNNIGGYLTGNPLYGVSTADQINAGGGGNVYTL